MANNLEVIIIGDFPILDWYELDDSQRAVATDRYGGLVELEEQEYIFTDADTVYIMGDIMRLDDNRPDAMRGWDGYHSDSFFSGTLFRIIDDGESATVAIYLQ